MLFSLCILINISVILCIAAFAVVSTKQFQVFVLLHHTTEDYRKFKPDEQQQDLILYLCVYVYT